MKRVREEGPEIIPKREWDGLELTMAVVGMSVSYHFLSCVQWFSELPLD
jgi:hypothetical protein